MRRMISRTRLSRRSVPTRMIESAIGVPWQDVALSAGGVVGTATKVYSAADPKTTWDRRSSGANAIMFIPTVIAFYSLGLYITMALSLTSMFAWGFICLFRGEE
jgi:hypothetical protein